MAQRYIDPQGNLVIRRLGVPRDFSEDLYHWMLSRPWWQLVPLLGSLFLTMAATFALLYALGGDCIQGARPGNIVDDFYFSVQTLATIGYGGMSPRGHYANLLVCLEAFSGLVSLALMTGLIFAKFSVPRSRIIFSSVMTVSKKDNRPALTFRLANARGNHIVDAHINLTLIRQELTPEGEPLRRIRRLELAVADTPLFALSFTATHFLDGDSPLAGCQALTLDECAAEFIVTMTGLDDVLGQTVHARHAYGTEDIRWGMRLADTLVELPDGQPAVDFGKFHDVIPWQV